MINFVAKSFSLMNLHYFNPGHEAAVFNGSPFYCAPANVQLLQNELSFLPSWYAQSNDFVLVGSNFDFTFYEKLKNNFPSFPQPIFVDKNCVIDFKNKENPNVPMSAAYWGVSPAAIHFFEKIREENAINLSVGRWKEEFTGLCSRRAAQKCLMYLKQKIPQITVDIPVFVNSMQNIENEINKTNEMLLVKEPFSSSGRGILRIDAQNFTRSVRQIVQGWLNRQGYVSIEKMYDKILDFAMEFRCTAGENTDFLGYSLFETDTKLSYTGNILDSQKNIEDKICKFIHIELIEKIRNEIGYFLNEKYKNYSGLLGIDMLIYISENQYFIYPCVEINIRANMGIVAINFVEKYLCADKTGRFNVNFCRKEGEVFVNHCLLTKNCPARFWQGKLCEGYLPLCPVNENNKFWAYVIVG